MFKVFIDGEAGTTGLQIRERLAGRREIALVSLGDDRRKDLEARREALNTADAAILCLPDAAARESAGLVETDDVVVIDASTAHRVAPGWTYGFPEMTPGQRAAVAGSKRIANPGCYPTGFIALVRPLVDAGLLPASWGATCHAVSGYSGGGKAMIAEFEDETSPDYTRAAFITYGHDLKHKHVPEMRLHAGLDRPPIFMPSVGRFRQGMIVEVPVRLDELPRATTVADLQAALAEAYAGEAFVEVASLEEARATPRLDPEALNGSNRLKLHVFGEAAEGQARLVAVLDNLGKGASGAAVQSLNLTLGLPEGEGL